MSNGILLLEITNSIHHQQDVILDMYTSKHQQCAKPVNPSALNTRVTKWYRCVRNYQSYYHTILGVHQSKINQSRTPFFTEGKKGWLASPTPGLEGSPISQLMKTKMAKQSTSEEVVENNLMFSFRLHFWGRPLGNARVEPGGQAGSTKEGLY